MSKVRGPGIQCFQFRWLVRALYPFYEKKRFFKLVYKITAGVEQLEQGMEGEKYLSSED